MPAVDLNFTLVALLIVLAIGALLVLVLDLVLPKNSARLPSFVVASGGVLLAGYYLVTLWSQLANNTVSQGFLGAVVVDHFSVSVSGILLITALAAILLSTTRREEELPGYLALLMWSTMGMMAMVVAGNLMTLFLGVEILSLGLYVMVAFAPGNLAGREGALKYLVLGSVATAFFLFGSALLFGETGSTSLMEMRSYVSALAGAPGLYLKVGLGLVLVGLTFKMALAPFHTWAPDAYQGAPAPVTAFMSVGTKAAAFAAILRVLVAVLPAGSLGIKLMWPVWLLGALSMFVGSLTAITQMNLKRLLAYSGVAHAGYLMMATVGLGDAGASAGVFYLYAYAFMNLGAMAVVVYLNGLGIDGANIESYRGLAYKQPWLSVAMTLFMLSLTGMPPAAGFIGKLRLLQAALQNGGTGLIVALVLTTGISAFAYLRVVLTMFARTEDNMVGEAATAEVAVAEDAGEISSPAALWCVGAVILAMAVGTLWLGVYPQSLLHLMSGLLPFA